VTYTNPGVVEFERISVVDDVACADARTVLAQTVRRTRENTEMLRDIRPRDIHFRLGIGRADGEMLLRIRELV